MHKFDISGLCFLLVTTIYCLLFVMDETYTLCLSRESNINSKQVPSHIIFEELDRSIPEVSILYFEPVRTRDSDVLTFNAAKNEAKPETKVTEHGDDKVKTNKSDVELLYLITQAEAGNQDLDGMRLVCDVVLNRVDSNRFPNTIEGVLFQSGQFTTAKRLREQTPSKMVREAVDMELSGKRLDSTSLFFARGPITHEGLYQHGDHYFSR